MTFTESPEPKGSASSYPDDLCRICGHVWERHTTSLPEEGSEKYCSECDQDTEYHDFAPACSSVHAQGGHCFHSGLKGKCCSCSTFLGPPPAAPETVSETATFTAADVHPVLEIPFSGPEPPKASRVYAAEPTQIRLTPGDTDATEADFDRMMAEGTPVRISTEPPGTFGAGGSAPGPEAAGAAAKRHDPLCPGLPESEYLYCNCPDCIRPTGCRDKLKRGCEHGCRAAADELTRLGEELEAPEEHTCKPGATLYWCPEAGEVESDCHGGFDVCCSHPEQHVQVEPPPPPPRRPPVAVAYALEDGTAYEVALPGDATIRADDGVLIIMHTQSPVKGLVQTRPWGEA